MRVNQKAVRWFVALLYICAIFAVTVFVNFWGILTGIFGTEGAGDFLNYMVPGFGAAVLLFVLFRLRRKRIRSLLWLAAVVSGYAFMLTLHCEYPADQIHLAQYSLLAWLLYRALILSYPPSPGAAQEEGTGRFRCCRGALRNNRALLLAALLTYVVGAADEGLQFFSAWLHRHYAGVEDTGAFVRGLLAVINPRHGDFADIATNWVAGSLGLIGLLAILDGGYWTWHKRRRLGTRFALGYLLPTVLAVVAWQQIWTRFIDRPINLLIITVDCCRPDRMSAYGDMYSRRGQDVPKTTEYLDKLMPDAIRFDNAYAQACWTAPGIVSTMTGLYPPAHGVDRAGNMLPAGVTTLLDGFRERGYNVPNLAYITDDATFQNLGSMQPLVENAEEKGMLVDWIGRHHREPFAMWYHYRHLHLPYVPEEHHLVYPPALIGVEAPELIREVVQKEVIIPKELVTFGPEYKEWIDALFDAQVRQFDHFFESIRYKLRLHHILNKTLIIITSDHGEELLEHGDLGHGSTLIHSKHYEHTLRIPLIMYAPKLMDTGRVITDLVEQVDVLPTVFELMGWPIPDVVQGRSLVPAIQGEQMEPRPVFASSIEGGYQSKPEMQNSWVHSMRKRNWKLIERVVDGNKTHELYDLALDPGELRDLAASNARLVENMSPEIDDWLATSVAIRERIVLHEEALRAEADSGGRVDPSLLSAPTITHPEDGAVIRYEDEGGRVTLRWTGYEQATYIIQHDVGEGFHSLPRGEREVVGTELLFGPYDIEFWNTLDQWNPYRIRVRPKDLPDAWSAWGQATFAPMEGQ